MKRHMMPTCAQSSSKKVMSYASCMHTYLHAPLQSHSSSSLMNHKFFGFPPGRFLAYGRQYSSSSYSPLQRQVVVQSYLAQVVGQFARLSPKFPPIYLLVLLFFMYSNNNNIAQYSLIAVRYHNIIYYISSHCQRQHHDKSCVFSSQDSRAVKKKLTSAMNDFVSRESGE